MKTKTITINIKEDLDRKLRRIASVRYGKRKGYIGKAINEAVERWAEREEERADIKALELLKTGFKMGKIKWKSRDELHER